MVLGQVNYKKEPGAREVTCEKYDPTKEGKKLHGAYIAVNRYGAALIVRRRRTAFFA
jgi:hypothetical protein